jgi:predicted short-subunit dehydrogenase-like oxidoreductase (DUF2520 family)
MKTIIFGSGNVATILGKKIQQAGHQVLQIVSRNDKHAANLSKLLNCAYTTSILSINKSADLYVFAISDTALTELDKNLNLNNKLIVHTAGSVPMDVLKNCSKNYGVLYPLQSIKKDMIETTEIPFLVDGNTGDNLTLIYDFAKTLSENVQIADDNKRLKLHVAAIVVNNFTNHLYTLAQDFCEKEQVDFKLLLPLIKETSERLMYAQPSKMQTGPAIRNDDITITKHLEQLENYPSLINLYKLFTENIKQFYKP